MTDLDLCYTDGLLQSEPDKVTKENAEGIVSQRKLRVFHIAVLGYLMTGGSPFGLEESVSSIGVFWTLVGISAVPLFYSIPQILMTCELSAMYPENGSYVTWVYEGLGPFGGWMNAWNSVLCNLIDNAIYPVQSLDYFTAIYPDLISKRMVIIVKFSIVFLGWGMNLFESNMMTNLSIGISTLTIFPFFVGVILSIPMWDPESQWNFDIPGGGDPNIPLFVATLLWQNSGWDGFGSFGAEVVDIHRTLIVGSTISIMMNFVQYMLVIIAASSSPEAGLDDWDDGSFTTLFQYFWNPLGVMICIACILDNTVLYVVGLGSTSRVIARLANGDGRNQERVYIETVDINILPSFLGYYWPRTNCPINAMTLQSLIILLLVFFDFSMLVQLDSFLNAVSLLLEFSAFIALRYSKPEAHRPYRIPGGMPFAWLITIVKVAFILVVIVCCTLTGDIGWSGVYINIIIALLYFVRRAVLNRCGRSLGRKD